MLSVLITKLIIIVIINKRAGRNSEVMDMFTA